MVCVKIILLHTENEAWSLKSCDSPTNPSQPCYTSLLVLKRNCVDEITFLCFMSKLNHVVLVPKSNQNHSISVSAFLYRVVDNWHTSRILQLDPCTCQ